MTPDELAELLDLYITDELPDALRARVKAHLSAHPEADRDAQTLRQTLARLQSAPAERPDSWFVERALGGLLREHAAAEAPSPSFAPSSLVHPSPASQERG